MFRDAALVFKNGELVVRDGEVVSERVGRAVTVRPERDPTIDRRMRNYFDERFGLAPDLLSVSEQAIGRPEPFGLVPCVR
jgi:formylmethanofuran dehydrogenase subunit A